VRSILDSIPSLHKIKITDADVSDDDNQLFALLPLANGDFLAIKSPPPKLDESVAGTVDQSCSIGERNSARSATGAHAGPSPLACLSFPGQHVALMLPTFPMNGLNLCSKRLLLWRLPFFVPLFSSSRRLCLRPLHLLPTTRCRIVLVSNWLGARMLPSLLSPQECLSEMRATMRATARPATALSEDNGKLDGDDGSVDVVTI
jgi:hypothetical protein